MNVLYIAYSCKPNSGSEEKVGWNVIFESSKINKVYVITKEEHRGVLVEFKEQQHLTNIDFFFVDIPSFYKRIYKGMAYPLRMSVWNKRAVKQAKKICKEKNIDIIHQITPVEYRSIGNYGKCSDKAKFICGPIGGCEYIPKGLKSYAKGYRFAEIIRACLNFLSSLKYFLNGAIKKCDYLLFANEETKEYIFEKSKFNKPWGVMSETGVSINELEGSIKKINNDAARRIRFLVSARFVYRKGHLFLLDALKGVPGELNYEVRFAGEGPLFAKIKKQCLDNPRLLSHISFWGNYLEKKWMMN